MPRPVREEKVRALLESILAELMIMRRVMPVHELRILKVKERTGWDSLLDPALDEVATVNAGMDAIGDQVRAELQAMRDTSR